MFTKFIRNQSGAIFSIEFAIIIPIFLIVILIFIELCRLLFVSSVLDMITVEGSYFVAKAQEADDYNQFFYDKISTEMPLWPLVTSDKNLQVDIVYCSLIDDAISYVNSGNGNCYNSPVSNSLAVFTVKYNFTSLYSESMFASLESILQRKVVVFKEY